MFEKYHLKKISFFLKKEKKEKEKKYQRIADMLDLAVRLLLCSCS